MFRDTDPIEEFMQVRVEFMSPPQLLEYIERWYQGLFNTRLYSDHPREVAMLKRLVRVYGKDAGRIVKWFFYRHGGIGAPHGRPERMRLTWWSAGHKYWHDDLLEEMRSHLEREDTPSLTPQQHGFADTERWIRELS